MKSHIYCYNIWVEDDFHNNPKDLDPSYKMYLDFLLSVWKGKLTLQGYLGPYTGKKILSKILR